MKCGHCPVAGPCVAEAAPIVCGYALADPAWAALVVDQSAMERPASGPTAESAGPDPRLAIVAACEHRGGVLPHPMQAECGCGGELSACGAGRGKVPGRVTLRDCLACVAAR